MNDRLLFLSCMGFALGVGVSTANAQPANDLIVSINGDFAFESDVQRRYFNRSDCGLGDDEGGGGTGGEGGMAGAGGTGGEGGMAGAGGMAGTEGGFLSNSVVKGDPESTTFQLRLATTGTPVSSVFLWLGTQGGECERAENRDLTRGNCGEIPGNPRSLGNDLTIPGLTLQDLLDADSGGGNIASCESSGLEGTPYEIFVFRNTNPGSMDVDPSQYGIANFYIDVEPPNPARVNTTPQRQSTFNISWGDPDPTDNYIELWSFWYSDSNDPSTAEQLSLTAPLNERSQNISASFLGLEEGETGYVFMTVYDQAFVSDQRGGNQSELSSSVEVTNVSVGGFCDATDDCTGCSAYRLDPNSEDGPAPTVWLFSLLFFGCVWRLRR